MAASQAEIVIKKARDRDQRLRKTYGITLDQYEQILELQDGKCAICGRKATDFTVSLNVDHVHFKVKAYRGYDGVSKHVWLAYVPGIFEQEVQAPTKIAVIKLAKQIAMPLSVRGLLCPGRYMGCNRLLGRVDKIEWLENTLKYLKDPPAKKVLTNQIGCDSMLSEGK